MEIEPPFMAPHLVHVFSLNTGWEHVVFSTVAMAAAAVGGAICWPNKDEIRSDRKPSPVTVSSNWSISLSNSVVLGAIGSLQ